MRIEYDSARDEYHIIVAAQELTGKSSLDSLRSDFQSMKERVDGLLASSGVVVSTPVTVDTAHLPLTKGA